MENDCINGKRKHSTINSIKIQKWTKKLFVCDVICRRTHVQCHSKSGSAFQIGSKKSLKTLKIFEWIAIDYTSSAHNKSNNNSLSIITFLWVITIRPTSHFQYFAINILIIKKHFKDACGMQIQLYIFKLSTSKKSLFIKWLFEQNITSVI